MRLSRVLLHVVGNLVQEEFEKLEPPRLSLAHATALGFLQGYLHLARRRLQVDPASRRLVEAIIIGLVRARVHPLSDLVLDPLLVLDRIVARLRRVEVLPHRNIGSVG